MGEINRDKIEKIANANKNLLIELSDKTKVPSLAQGIWNLGDKLKEKKWNSCTNLSSYMIIKMKNNGIDLNQIVN